MKKSSIVGILVAVLIIGGGVYYFQEQTPSSTEIPLSKTVIRLGHLPLPQAVFYAKDKGYFDEVGLDVQLKEFTNANLMMEAMLRGELEGTGNASYSTLLAFENKVHGKFKVYHGTSETKDTGWSSLVVKKGSGITSPEQLKGKKIVTRTGLASKVLAEGVFKGMGLNMTDIELIQIEPNLLIQAFGTPDVSAFLDAQPHGTILVQKGLGEVLIVSPRPRYIIDPFPTSGAVLSTYFIAKNPEAAKKFLEAVEKTIDAIKIDDPGYREAIKKYLKLEDDVMRNMPLSRVEKLSEIDRVSVDRLADFEVQHKILDKKPDTSSFYLDK